MKSLNKNDIFNQAFSLFEKKGLEAVTARNIARNLSCSPTPIYSYYNSMEELKLELIENAKQIFLNYIKISLDNLNISNIGLGMCKFAEENKSLFNIIFLEKEYFSDLIKEFKDILKKEVYKKIEVTETYEKKEALFDNFWVYIYGLSVLIAKNLIVLNEEEIKEKIINISNSIFHKI